MNTEFELIAKTFMGLEPVLAQELTQLGANNVEIGRRMVSFTGDKHLMYRANFALHTALKILKPIRHFKAQSADDVYKALLAEDMDVGLATVYRVLTQFETAGILIRHHFDTDYATFELDDGYHHDHLVCLRCGAVEEFVDREIEARQEEIAKRFGFVIT